ncbi:MAG: phosphoribosylglycinamide formyltransferase [Acidiferrobacter thiooxydans]|jgi:phosphoribosylglycinamide formyltransferase-1
MVSGRGSNLRALQEEAPEQGYVITGVVSNNPTAPAVDYARDQGLAVRLVDHRRFATRAAFEETLATALDDLAPDIIALAGFLRVLGADFVGRYQGRLLNIHPSLLPAFPGLDTHRRALASGARVHGATVHLVTDAVDGGPIIAQAGLTVIPGEPPAALAARVLALEHALYPYVLGRWARGEIADR